jgi:hypothetical protein
MTALASSFDVAATGFPALQPASSSATSTIGAPSASSTASETDDLTVAIVTVAARADVAPNTHNPGGR